LLDDQLSRPNRRILCRITSHITLPAGVNFTFGGNPGCLPPPLCVARASRPRSGSPSPKRLSITGISGIIERCCGHVRQNVVLYSGETPSHVLANVGWWPPRAEER
jgi:hypothetical protein